MIRKVFLIVLTLAFGCLMANAADISGTWKGQFITPVGTIKYTYVFKVAGNTLTGTATSREQGTQPVQNGKIEGDKISFTEPGTFQGAPITSTYKGTIQGDKIKLVHQFGDFPADTFTITRVN